MHLDGQFYAKYGTETNVLYLNRRDSDCLLAVLPCKEHYWGGQRRKENLLCLL